LFGVLRKENKMIVKNIINEEYLMGKIVSFKNDEEVIRYGCEPLE